MAANGGGRAIHFLGGASIVVDGQAASGRATHRHRIALLAILIAAEGHAVTRDKLIAYLWPEKDVDGGRNLLKVAVHELRKEFGDAAIRTTGDQLSANLSALDSDVGAFLGAIARVDDRHAAALYGGPFLDGFFLKDAEEFTHWVEGERARLAAAYASTLERLANAAEAVGDAEDALRWYRAVCAHDPYSHDAAERLVRALVRVGDNAAAVQFAETFARRLKDDLAIDDDGALMTIARTVTGGKRTPIRGTASAIALYPADAPPAHRASESGGSTEVPTPPARAVGNRWIMTTIVIVALAVAAWGAVRGFGRRTDTAAVERSERIGEFAGRPPAAVSAFLAGDSAYKSSRYADAERYFSQALDADSTFAAAGLQLALANSWTTINENYGRGRDAALKFQASLSPRDRAFFKAYFGPDPALGPAQPAPVYLAAWEDVVEKYPDWAEAWYQLGDRYYHYGSLSGLADPLDRARAAFRRALAQDSVLAEPLHHLVELYAARGETAELRRTSGRYFAANPAVNRNASAIAWETAVALGDSAWVKSVRANFPAMSREDLTRIAWITIENGWAPADARQAELLLEKKSTTTSEHEKSFILAWGQGENDGRPGDAHDAATALGAIFPAHPVGALWDLYSALFGGADSVRGKEAIARLTPFVNAAATGDHVARDQHHLSVCVLGYWRAAHGDIVGAGSLLRKLNDETKTEDNNFALRNARVCGAMLAASIAVQSPQGDASRLVAQLDTILLRERVPPHVILTAATLASSRMHAALGENAEALVAARRREHLTGDPLLISEQRRMEQSLSRKP